MRSEIRNIRSICKTGAFGNPNAIGFWIYGKRKDGRTVACKSEVDLDGNITIWSDRFSDGPFIEQDVTEFSKDEWAQIRSSVNERDQVLASEAILIARTRDCPKS